MHTVIWKGKEIKEGKKGQTLYRWKSRENGWNEWLRDENRIKNEKKTEKKQSQKPNKK